MPGGAVGSVITEGRKDNKSSPFPSGQGSFSSEIRMFAL